MSESVTVHKPVVLFDDFTIIIIINIMIIELRLFIITTGPFLTKYGSMRESPSESRHVTSRERLVTSLRPPPSSLPESVGRSKRNFLRSDQLIRVRNI